MSKLSLNTLLENKIESVEAFSLEDEIKKMEENPRRDINILAMYFSERQPDLRNNEQYQAAFKRHIKSASQLIVFDDDQILDAVPKARELTPGWTLETLLKILTK